MLKPTLVGFKYGGFIHLYVKLEIAQRFLFVYPQINGIMKREKWRPDMKSITLNFLLFANSIFLILYIGLAINDNIAFSATGTVSLFRSEEHTSELQSQR